MQDFISIQESIVVALRLSTFRCPSTPLFSLSPDLAKPAPAKTNSRPKGRMGRSHWLVRPVGSRVQGGVQPSESRMQKETRGGQRSGKRAGSGGPKGVAEKQRDAEVVQGQRRSRGWTVACVGVTDPGRPRAFWLSV
jgi:hypothetical protein